MLLLTVAPLRLYFCDSSTGRDPSAPRAVGRSRLRARLNIAPRLLHECSVRTTGGAKSTYPNRPRKSFVCYSGLASGRIKCFCRVVSFMAA